jgi:hypothetical protein
VKITPANQTFIPASTSARQRFAVASRDDEANSELGQALRTAVTGTQLRSVTIVAARAPLVPTDTSGTGEADDNVVVVQAQFAPDLDADTTAAPSVPKLISRQLLSRPSSGSGRGSSYMSPLEQYARTQSGEITSQPLVDVRA